MARLAGKRMVITGSSRGLGRGFAAASAAAGASVIVNGTNETVLSETAEAIRAAGGKVVAVPGSVAEPAVAKALVRTCVERFGGIDVMVNNAGIVRDRTLLKMTAEEWDAVIEVHLRGAFLCTQQAALAMREAGGGHIIQVISASGLSGGFGQGNYAAAKEGMIGLMRTALLEFSRFNIRNNALWPIGQTDMTQVVFERARAAAAQQGEPPPDPVAMGFGTPDEVAAGLVWLASDGAAHFNGQILTFNGRKTGLWTHPAERHAAFRDAPWSADDLDAYYKNIQPLPVNAPVRTPPGGK
ncbi:MAG: SDR family NAD(P)-dependent oxidoreductase [Gammaproteobacteria bacterium]|nr:SDR family NAD(P)-dependent oxidoreductase [Gammaproteobacteria bacterium]